MVEYLLLHKFVMSVMDVGSFTNNLDLNPFIELFTARLSRIIIKNNYNNFDW